MPVIKLTPEVLEDSANKLREASNLNKDVIDRLDNLIESLNADWEGDAYNAFRDSYNNKRQTFQEFNDDMVKFVDFLNKFADVMREEERRQADAARNL
ncbi:MAG: WXG100 family type VII secretion target [Synergistaceae bacterium]|nr:WXG100 family type VII secretion target [Synergistaceae bacterium]